ncbi:MAG TPA: hypothetical protein VGH22_15465 [Candidatus Binatia bacterium]|jgi:hypothetical protein
MNEKLLFAITRQNGTASTPRSIGFVVRDQRHSCFKVKSRLDWSWRSRTTFPRYNAIRYQTRPQQATSDYFAFLDQ